MDHSLRSIATLLVFILSSLVIVISSQSCVWNNYDFSPLQRADFRWHLKTKLNDVILDYQIKLCSALDSSVPAQCKNASVCLVKDKDTLAVGFATSELNVTEDTNNSELRLHLQGETCKENPQTVYKTNIIFKCGKDLGFPVFLDSYACDTYIEWYSTVACKKSITGNGLYVPCYVYGSEDNRFDLSPLIKVRGAFRVETMDDSDFFINVCRDISPDGESASCPAGSSACRIVGGNAYDVGKPTSPVMRTSDNKLSLHYSADNPGPGCTSHSSTEITFICPQRGKNSGPRLTSDNNCQYEIEWETEYACQEDTLTSDSCQLNMVQHGIHIDLSPLGGKLYNISHGEYVYRISICSPVAIKCPDTAAAGTIGCQAKDPSFGKIIGKDANHTLRYSDRDLTLKYGGGDPCSSAFKREIIINFHCLENAEDDGRGNPVFSTEDECTYVFDWNTKYACVDNLLENSCQVQVGKKLFDLSPLQADPNEEDWDVEVNEGTSDKGSYFMNICAGLVKPHSAGSSSCPDTAAICFLGADGIVKSLGQYQTSPVYDAITDTIHLNYSSGDSCTGSKRIHSHVIFRCKPGDLESGPVLTMVSDDKCFYELEWYTAAACTVTTKRGENCSVFDDTMGLYFELNSLKNGSDGYKVSAPSHDYYIDVCTDVQYTACKGKHAGVCQIDKTDSSKVVNAGQPSGELFYKDGLIKLTYRFGDAYHTSPPVNRSSELVFICDHTAGRGSPEFQAEANYTYSFLWRSANVCPRPPVECAFTDPKTGKDYDLSRLVKGEDENWEVEKWEESGKRKKFYLNVCRPLNPAAVKKGCSPLASVCSTEFHENQENVAVENFGQTQMRPQMEDGGIILTYTTMAQTCTDTDGTKKAYTSSIHFRCQPDQVNEKPVFLDSEGPCDVSFLWSTEAACDLESSRANTTDTSCMIADPHSQHFFNFKPLTRKPDNPYSVKYGNTSMIKLNICGSLGAGVCGTMHDKEPAACLDTTFLANQDGVLTFTDTGHASLTYTNQSASAGNRAKVVINFICNKSVAEGELILSEKPFIFELHTALACRPEPVECIVFDRQGNSYDLGHLTRPGGHWKVADSRSSHRDLSYYINVCAPVANVTSCPDEAVGGCVVSSSGAAWDMGYVQSKPVAMDNGTITLRYLGGQICHKGTPSESHRSTRINFFCSRIEEDPIFVGETATCEYIFDWKTPSACSIHRVLGSDCTVTEPLYNTTYSFKNLLHTSGSNHIVTAGGFQFDINICGPILNGQANCAGAGACQTTQHSKFSMGKPNDKIVYEDGELSLVYHDGDICHGKYPRETHIKFVCDHKSYGYSPEALQYINETDSCAYQFVWKTSLACNPFKVVQCGITDNQGNNYELSPLTLTDDNYEINVPSKRQKFVFNVCTTLVHKKGVTCPPNSVACVIDLDEKDPAKKYKKIGQLDDTPVRIDNIGLTITYNSGERCPDGASYSTMIHLICNKNALDTSPTYMYQEGCSFHFQWESRYACATNNLPVNVTDDCTARNPLTGYTFDLKRWKSSSSYQVKDDGGNVYDLNICDSLANSPCGPKAGVCQTTVDGRHFNAGNATAQVHFEQGVLMLNYTGGQLCHHSNTTRTTILQFVCAPGTGQGQPQFIDESDDCTYYIKWSTEYVCENQEDWTCSVDDDNGNIIDLSVLVKPAGGYQAMSIHSDSAYYINICHPLGTLPAGHCPPLAAACKVYGSQSQSLGRISSKPTWNSDTSQVVLTYKNGDSCNTEPGRNMATKIFLKCNVGDDQGTPNFISTDDCTNIFTWATNAVCVDNTPVTHNCTIKNPQTSQVYDLSHLSNSTPYQINSSLSMGTYFLNMCGGQVSTEQGCEKAAVCLVNEQKQGTSFGLASSMSLEMSGQGVRAVFTGGVDCASTTGKSNASTIINFSCDSTVQGTGKPELNMRTACGVVFDWKTPVVCPLLRQPCIFDGYLDLNILSHASGSWHFSGRDKTSYWLNLCTGIQQGPSGCPPTAAACQKKKGGSVEVIGLAEKQRMYYSSDNVAVLEYSGGTTCNGKGSTKVYLPCGKTLGAPQPLPSDPRSCSSDFIWKTRLACKEPLSEVKVVNGLIKEPRTGYTLDLNTFTGKGVVNATVQENGTKYIYYMALYGSLQVKGCEGAAVCRVPLDGNTGTMVIGSTNSRSLYMEGDTLEMISSSDKQCQPEREGGTNISILIHCSRTSKSEPSLVYKSPTCDYIFWWYTPLVCFTVDIDYSPVTSRHVNSAAAAIITLLVVTLIVVLILILHKPERRAAISNRFRRIFRHSGVGRSMSYSRLSNGEADESNSLLGGSRSQEVRSFPLSDDSDEDMIQ